MKLPKGSLKVILPVRHAPDENFRRTMAGERTQFVPPFEVLVVGANGGYTLHAAWDVAGPALALRYAKDGFPFDWAPTGLRSVRQWAETTGELTLTTEYDPEKHNG